MPETLECTLSQTNFLTLPPSPLFENSLHRQLMLFNDAYSRWSTGNRGRATSASEVIEVAGSNHAIGVILNLAWGPNNFSPSMIWSWRTRSNSQTGLGAEYLLPVEFAFCFCCLFYFSPLYHHYLKLSFIRVWKKSLQSDKSGSLSRDTKRRRLWSSAELTGDVIISSVQIKNFKKPCTRSNATIATSTNKNALISQSNDPLLSSTAQFLQVQLLDLSLDAPSRYFMVILESLRLRVASGAHGSVHFLSWVKRKIDFTPASLVWLT